MGVPRLAPFIFKNFSRHRYDKRFQRSFTISNLYIDANAVLHKSAQRVFNYGDGNFLNPLYPNLTLEEKTIKCFEGFIDDLQVIIDIASPSSLVFIALDGTAPIAKQAQQRQRRFVSMRGNSIDDGNTFSSVMITPGTAWMNQLDEWMKTIGVKRLVVKQDTCVIFSSCFIPGEGEHKLLEYIRERAPVDDYFRSHQTHCHFGPDGDLIMLALATQVQYVYLLRDGREIGTYDFLDASSIRSDLVNVLYATKNANTKSVCNRSPTDAANDFIFAGFFVGNDFLPKVNMFFFLEDGLEMMIRIIDALAFHGMYITQNGAITRNIQKFVEAIAQSEYTYISDQQFQQVPETEDDRFVNWTLVDSLNKKGTLDFQMYRDLYYKKAFNVDVVTPQYISEMCEKFWRMLVWVFVYYTQGIEHSGWEEIYPYHYAPMMTDLAKYLQSIHDSKFFCTFNRGRPSTHIEQLCSVLPPSASHLVPKKFSSILSGNLDFSIDYEGKTKEYQGIALIDFVDITTIRKKVAKIGNSQSPDQLRFFAHK